MKLFWSNIKLFRECPKKFLWSKGHKEIDLGFGLGKPVPVPPEDKKSEHHLLMGSVLSRVVEEIYNRELWKDTSTFMKKALKLAEVEFHLLEPKYHLEWKQMTRQEALDIVLQGTKNFLIIMCEHKLVGSFAQSEVAFVERRKTVEGDIGFCGYADLVIRKDLPDGTSEMMILDGKNSSTPGVGVDPDQLIWYAICMQAQWGEKPTKLGFFYFRYPSTNPPASWDEETQGKWTGFVEVKWDESDMKRLLDEALATKRAIDNKAFEANPIPKVCTDCPYEELCEERQAQKKANALKRGHGKSSKDINIPEAPEGGGFFTL